VLQEGKVRSLHYFTPCNGNTHDFKFNSAVSVDSTK
jgi:hypothetical protein